VKPLGTLRAFKIATFMGEPMRSQISDLLVLGHISAQCSIKPLFYFETPLHLARLAVGFRWNSD